MKFFYYYYYYYYYLVCEAIGTAAVSRDSAVGIATGYGLGD
jgi:hypothetical protein